MVGVGERTVKGSPMTITLSSGQFHQRSTHSFYVRKLRVGILCLHFRFVLYWHKPTGAKAVHRMLMKLSPHYGKMTPNIRLPNRDYYDDFVKVWSKLFFQDFLLKVLILSNRI